MLIKPSDAWQQVQSRQKKLLYVLFPQIPLSKPGKKRQPFKISAPPPVARYSHVPSSSSVTVISQTPLTVRPKSVSTEGSLLVSRIPNAQDLSQNYTGSKQVTQNYESKDFQISDGNK